MRTKMTFTFYNAYGTDNVRVDLNESDNGYEITYTIYRKSGVQHTTRKKFDSLATAQLKYIDAINTLIIYA